MPLYLQYATVFVVVAAAAWVSWRKLTGKHVLRRGRKSEGCAACSGTGAEK
jgi:hypothetical protein